MCRRAWAGEQACGRNRVTSIRAWGGTLACSWGFTPVRHASPVLASVAGSRDSSDLAHSLGLRSCATTHPPLGDTIDARLATALPLALLASLVAGCGKESGGSAASQKAEIVVEQRLSKKAACQQAQTFLVDEFQWRDEDVARAQASDVVHHLEEIRDRAGEPGKEALGPLIDSFTFMSQHGVSALHELAEQLEQAAVACDWN